MSGTHTTVGTYGDMPFDMYMRKMDRTCTFESPHQLDDYFRDELVDVRPSPPTLESDQIRGSGFDNDGSARGGFESRGRINLRIAGKRALTEPWLPDGTFLDQQFTEPDPRSCMPDPDFRKYADQQFARARFVKKFSDEDFSIPESGIAPGEMVRNIKHAQYRVADSMKIFEDSMSNFQNGGIGVLPKQDRYLSSVDDRRPSDIADFSLQNRRNKTTAMSDLTPIGWNTTTDHTFRVSKYGRITVPAIYATDGHYQNRAASRLDHEVFFQVEEKVIPKATALLISDLTRLKRAQHETGFNPIFNDARELPLATRKQLIAASETGIFGKSIESRAQSAHSLLPAEVKVDGRQTIPRLDRNRFTKGVLSPVEEALVARAALLNRVQATRDTDDLRGLIDQSGPVLPDPITAKPRAFVDLTGDVVMMKHISDYSFPKGEEKQVYSYKSGPLRSAGSTQPKYNFEPYGGRSMTAQQRRQLARSQDEFGRYYGALDNDFGRDDERTHRGGTILGSKMTRQFHATEDRLED